MYAYCVNNPVNFVDPWGEKMWKWLETSLRFASKFIPFVDPVKTSEEVNEKADDVLNTNQTGYNEATEAAVEADCDKYQEARKKAMRNSLESYGRVGKWIAKKLGVAAVDAATGKIASKGLSMAAGTGKTAEKAVGAYNKTKKATTVTNNAVDAHEETK